MAPPRFLAFLAIFFVVTGAALAAAMDWRHALMTGFDIAGVAFLASCLAFLAPATPERMREEAERNDANRELMLVITSLVMLVVLVTVAAELGSSGAPHLRGAFVVGTLAITWLFSNTVFALHYAHLYYGSDNGERHRGGLEFNGAQEPDYGDFLYFSVTLGMTFQTSDVAIVNRRFRRFVTFHCLAAFVYNLGVLAFTISVLSGGVGQS
ncbi:MAG: hypothetical protein JWO81_837 [Alphaproteobacteria bacterium]|nr:hypothetical protein [Alphaproteobacteria bacterium]